MLQLLVLPDGTLDETKIAGRDLLYTRRNGKRIERFYVQQDGRVDSYIFKPLASEPHLGKEVWAQERILPLLPTGYARIAASADHDDPQRYWMIFEDMGTIDHTSDEALVIDMAAAIPHWHRLPPDIVPPAYREDSDKPSMRVKLADIRAGRVRLAALLARLGVSVVDVELLLDIVDRADGGSEIVVSHGDLHRGNFFARNGSIVILDWEHLHLDSVYWDLYCLLDMTHPYHPQRTDGDLRLRALDAYADRRRQFGWTADRADFVGGYHLHAVLYSLWLLLIIENDLLAGKWEPEQLQEQLNVTCASLVACLPLAAAHLQQRE